MNLAETRRNGQFSTFNALTMIGPITALCALVMWVDGTSDSPALFPNQRPYWPARISVLLAKHSVQNELLTDFALQVDALAPNHV